MSQHEVGMIAEAVGAVLPEVVTWENNGKDAQRSNYGWITALLLEATKEQQALIRKQQEQIKYSRNKSSGLCGKGKQSKPLSRRTDNVAQQFAE